MARSRVPLVLVAAVATLATAGCAAASHGTTTPRPATSGADVVYLTDYSTDDGPNSTVVLAGAIGDYGTGVSVHPDGTVDPDHTSQLELKLSRGTFRLDIGTLHGGLTSAFRSFPTNHVTCSGEVRVSANVPVVSGSGTGAYQRASGAFDLTVTIDEVDATAGCSASSPPLAQSVVIAGQGQVTLG